MQNKKIKNLKELKKTSLKLVKAFKIPQIVLLKGPLAVGKSQMVQYMVEALGGLKDIRSPTFSLINIYETPKNTKIYHVDLYRLKNLEDIETTAFWDIFYEPTIIFVEWPQLVEKKLPPFWNKLYIELKFYRNQNSRIIKWNRLNSQF